MHFFFQLTVVLTSWGHARPDTPVLLLCRQGGIGLWHLQDVIDDILFVHRTGQRNRPWLAEELRLSILQVIQDVIQLWRLESKGTKTEKCENRKEMNHLRLPFRKPITASPANAQTHVTCAHIYCEQTLWVNTTPLAWGVYLGDENSRLGLVYNTAVTPG